MWQKTVEKLKGYYFGRYTTVLILFVLAFIFGKNMNILSPKEQQLQDQADAQKKITVGIYDVPTDRSQSGINNLFSVKRGQCGRLFFGLKNFPAIDSSSRSQKIKVLLSNDFGKSQELGSYELSNDRFVQYQEVDFCANSDYQSLIFAKDESSLKSSFEISDLAFYPLSISKNNFSNLAASITGNTDFSRVVYDSGFDPKNATDNFKFTRSNQMVGQTFTASSNTISGVDLKMGFIGSGGIGNYSLELREIAVVDGKNKLSADKIGYYYFDKNNADKNLKVANGVYHIPLAAHTEIGRTYFIGISNQAAKFNPLNTLNVYSRGTSSNSGKMLSFVDQRSREMSGDLYFKVYGTDYVKVANEKVLTEAKILDNGDGAGFYTYEQKGNFSDYLDLEQTNTLDNKYYNIFYDNIYSGVSAKAEDDNNFVYKINMLHPFSFAKVKADQPGGTFCDSLVYYSFDNENWQEIKADLAFSGIALENKFEKLIQGDGTAKTLYIKVTYNKDSIEGEELRFFGLKSLKIIAELMMK